MNPPTPTPDPLSLFTDLLVADPFNSTGVWGEFAAACRANDRATLAHLAEQWIAAEDLARGELLVLTLSWWPVARQLAARFLRCAAPLLRETARDVIAEAQAEHRAKLSEAHAVVDALGQVATQAAAGHGVKVGVA